MMNKFVSSLIATIAFTGILSAGVPKIALSSTTIISVCKESDSSDSKYVVSINNDGQTIEVETHPDTGGFSRTTVKNTLINQYDYTDSEANEIFDDLAPYDVTTGTPICQVEDVSLELVLSVDVSGSVSSDEYNTQVNGYIAAFNDADVQQAIKDLPNGMAVTMQFWADRDVAEIGWFKLTNNGDSIDGLSDFTTAIGNVSRSGSTVTINGVKTTTGSGTDIKSAIDEAASLMLNNRYYGTRLVMDVSGDGIPDDTDYDDAIASWEYGYKDGQCGYTLDCPPVENARDAAIAAGISINGLPINNSSAGSKTVTDIDGNNVTVSLLEDRIDDYYRSQVVGGTNSFIQVANGFDDFATAAQRKILREISDDNSNLLCNSSSGCELKNNPPVAVDNQATVVINSDITLDVVENDTDIDNDLLTITSFEIDDNNGSLNINENNQLVYTAPSTPGIYTFMYEIKDGKGGIDKAEVEVEVTESYPD